MLITIILYQKDALLTDEFLDFALVMFTGVFTIFLFSFRILRCEL